MNCREIYTAPGLWAAGMTREVYSSSGSCAWFFFLFLNSPRNHVPSKIVASSRASRESEQPEQLFSAEHGVPDISFDGQGPPRGGKLERVVCMVDSHHELCQCWPPYDAIVWQGNVRNIKDDCCGDDFQVTNSSAKYPASPGGPQR